MPTVGPGQPADRPETRVAIAGIGMDLVGRGQGAPCLLLYGIGGIHPASPFVTGLAARYRLFAPWHPECGHSETVSGVNRKAASFRSARAATGREKSRWTT